jgi:hypothetical protein
MILSGSAIQTKGRVVVGLGEKSIDSGLEINERSELVTEK